MRGAEVLADGTNVSEAQAESRRAAIVDVGSNTARIVVYRYDAGRWFRLEDSIREPIRLAEGLAAEGRLRPAAVKRALGALKMFADYGAASDVDSLEVFATSGLRDAPNGAEVVAKIRRLGLDVTVLSGEQEAELGVLAVANGFTWRDAWVVDLGGGSLQLSRMEGRRFLCGSALPLGAVRMTEAHLRSDPPTPGEVAAVEAVAEQWLSGPLAEVAANELPLVAMGGTVRNLARIVQRRSAYPLSLLHGYFLRREDLEALVLELLARPLRRRRRLPGLSTDRADVIVAGGLVVRWLVRHSGRDGIWISGHGVREGAFFRRFLPRPPHLLEDVRAFSVQNRFENFPQNRPHNARVRFLARRLFDELEPLHGLGSPDAELLDAAAVLHDIGTTIGYYRHHRHGAFLINASSLHGFDHREQALISLLVRYHRSNLPKLGSFAHICTADDEQRLRALVVCLRLAEFLERSRSGRVQDVEVGIKRRRVRLALRAAEVPSVEISETLKHAPLFEQVFGRRLEIRADCPG